MSLMVCQGSILLTILKNPWFSQFPSQVMATLFLTAFWLALRTHFVYSNINFDSSSRTGNILHKNAGPPYNVIIIKINVALGSGVHCNKLEAVCIDIICAGKISNTN